MNMLNKNLIRRRMSIFLLLTLYMGLCFEAAALEVMVVGDSHELDGGYSIELANAEGDKAFFVLYTEGGWVDEADVSSGDRFSLDDENIFHFEATLDSVFRSDDMHMVELTDYNWEWNTDYDWEWKEEPVLEATAVPTQSEPTLSEIRSAMGTFLAREAGKDDMVCIYFAGHGSPEIDPTGKADDKLEKFIVPYDAKKDDLFGYGLSMDTIREILDERIKSKRAVFFIDSCYSGEAGGRTFSRPDVAARNITISEKFLEQLSGEGRIIITASKPDELSLETDELRHGIFTYYLAEGLRGKADLNKDGVVTVDELYSYVYEKVTKEARKRGGNQHPLRKGTIVGEISLTRYETEDMVYIRELNLNASRLFEEENYEEALAIWSEVLKRDRESAEALAGSEKSKKKIEEAEAILREKQRRLLDLHKGGLPAKEYDEAMILLKKNPMTYTELERNIVEYIEKLLKGDISSDVYVDTLNLIKENYKR